MEGYSHRDSILEALVVVQGQWVVAVLMTLLERPMQYSELRTAINTVEDEHGWRTHKQPLSEKVLTSTLQRMRRNGLVLHRAATDDRQTGDRTPYFYQLTPMGRALLRALRELGTWHQQHQRQLEEAQARFDTD